MELYIIDICTADTGGTMCSIAAGVEPYFRLDLTTEVTFWGVELLSRSDCCGEILFLRKNLNINSDHMKHKLHERIMYFSVRVLRWHHVHWYA